MSKVDVLFLGSSPNALAGAARLAKSGVKVAILERRKSIGGPVATESIADGVRADVGVASIALDPEIAKELGVSVETIRREAITSLSEKPATLPSIELPEHARQAIEILRGLYRASPPSTPKLAGDDATAIDALSSGLRGLGARAMHEVLRLTFMSVRDFADESFADETTRAIVAAAAVRALSEGPFAQGTLFGLLHHEAISDGFVRSSARGGVASVANALADVAKRHGVEIRTDLGGELRVLLESGVAKGAILGDGSKILADAIVSDDDARATFTRLVSPTELEPEVNRAIRAIRYRGSVARVHLVLRSLPEFKGVDPKALRGALVVAPTVASIERAWDDCKRGAASASPYFELTFPTVADPSLAEDGQHLLDAWVQYVPYKKSDRHAVRKSVIDALAPFAPGLKDLVVAERTSLPEDLERDFGVTEGQLYGGEARLEQAFFLRPIPGFAHYESPIERLYLGGSAAHPGGYSGRSGWNLAARLLTSTKA